MSDSAHDFRTKLGGRLVIWSTGALTALGAIIIISAAAAGGKDKNELILPAAQMLFSSLLPLFATWVGTVLAFYYSKENFEAASRGTMDLFRTVQQRLVATNVADAWIPWKSIVAVTIPDGRTIDDLAIADIEAAFKGQVTNGQPVSRLLIVTGQKSCVAVIHKSIFMEMLASGLRQTPTPLDPATAPLGEMLKQPLPGAAGATYKNMVQTTLAFVGKDRTLADAKAAMEAVSGCQDVIVTETGSTSEPVQGWVTNVDITRKSLA